MYDESINNSLGSIYALDQDNFALHTAMAKVEMTWMGLVVMILGGILLVLLFNVRSR